MSRDSRRRIKNSSPNVHHPSKSCSDHLPYQEETLANAWLRICELKLLKHVRALIKVQASVQSVKKRHLNQHRLTLALDAVCASLICQLQYVYVVIRKHLSLRSRYLQHPKGRSGN